jgi:hypothetical protein
MAQLMLILALVHGLRPGEIWAAQKTGSTLKSTLIRKVERFEARNSSVLEALLRLGQENQICLGVESAEPELSRRLVNLLMADVSVGDAVKEIIATFPGTYSFREELGVVLIRNLRAPEKTWLDFKISTFRCTRSSVQAVNNLLWMTVATQINPKIGGFAGSYPSGDLSNLTGPFNEHGRTLRQLLCLIVSKSKGGMWIVTEPPGNASFVARSSWVIVEYSRPFSENLSRLLAR